VTKDNRPKVLSLQLAKKLLPLSLAIGIVITIGIPIIYYHSESVRAEKEATTYARMLAGNIRKLASEAPLLWKYQATKYAQMISDFIPHKGIKKITLMDEKRNTLNQYSLEVQGSNDWSKFPIEGDPAPILFNNHKIGEVIVAVSGYSIIVSSLLSFLICGGIGISLAYLSYRVPLKAVSILERRIMAYQQSLEEQVEQRTIALQETTQKALLLAEHANAANRSKSQFLANMSHELRTPLNHIIGFTELVADRAVGPVNATQEEYLNDVLGSSRHLLSLINDILDLSKIEAGKMELEVSEVALQSLLENSLVMIKEKAMNHGIKIGTRFIEIPPIIRADERKLKQILYNLLSNAVKFTPDGGSVLLEAQSADGQQGVQITVSDTGIGVPEANLERIFQPFEQGDNSSGRKYQGTGLGLSLTQKMVELHGGRIWAKSGGIGMGTAFHVVLPIQPNFDI
jgi:signal transduction histidine kinase